MPNISKTKQQISPEERLAEAVKQESEKFQEYYLWLETAMPPAFFDEVDENNRLLVVHNLMGFNLQEYFTSIHLKHSSIVMCVDTPDADLKVLKDYALYGIKTYQAYVSKEPLPFPGESRHLRIVQIFFTEAVGSAEDIAHFESKEELRALVMQRNPKVTDEEFDKIMNSINIRFLRSLPLERLILAMDMFFRAQTRDNCQYEVRYNEDWKEKEIASMQIVLAWKNTPKYHFLYRIARIIHRYNLRMKKVNAAYIDPYSPQSILVMAISLHGSKGEAVWDETDIPDFLREFATAKYFASFDTIDEQLLKPELVPGRMGNFLRCCINFVHQNLVYLDPYLYTIERIEDDLCRHPELTSLLCEAFEARFDPDHRDEKKYFDIRKKLLKDIENLDTGHPGNDLRRKNILRQALSLVEYCLKTNYFRLNYTSVAFRLDPKYLDEIPFDRKKKFPELPYGIFFIKGMHFFGFQIRFKDLARGGVRTVYPKQTEHMITERNNVFAECYNLAYTQHKKNKDIPEAGSKAIIFLKPFERLDAEATILENELESSGMDPDKVKKSLKIFRKEHEAEYLYQAQRSFISSLITIINCEEDGTIRAKNIVNYWKRPEYIYLGPDENMHDSMIQWIAKSSTRHDYKPGSAFISGKPTLGINHKEFGVTSLGVNVYMEELLKHLGKDPKKDTFTVKISGGPDGDVAGNQIRNLQKYYHETAKLIALTDVSGTIYDPKGLDLDILVELFHQQRPIKYYPPEKLHVGGFLVDKQVTRQQTALIQQTLSWKVDKKGLKEEWLSGSEMNHLFRNNVHQTPVDIFIPAGGRPRTLNRDNIEEYLDKTGAPTSKGIVEGANLYLTPDARQFLEKKGTLIIKDSSANKTGVICSSFEVLCGLVLDNETFIAEKPILVKEVLERLKQCALNEARLMLDTHKKTGEPLTVISDRISERINHFMYEILDHLDTMPLPEDPKDLLIQHFLDYALPTLREKYSEALMEKIPDHHKKAIIACHLAGELVYEKGLDWSPSVIDVLPVLIGQCRTG